MVPGMGAKISVLIHFSFVFFVKIVHNISDQIVWENTPFFKKDSLTLYLKEKLKSSAYIFRLIQRFGKKMPDRSYNTFSSGVFYAAIF
jgi:hypothetical protein